LAEIERALERHIAALNIPALFASALDHGWQKLRGRI
jgi:hypothetical protein